MIAAGELHNIPYDIEPFPEIRSELDEIEELERYKFLQDYNNGVNK